ncbi:MAG: hypothetical protein IPJ34_28780 [Myxococcales bacterium]|nr:hypothetical protein [Myxococcales bacterium]
MARRTTLRILPFVLVFTVACGDDAASTTADDTGVDTGVDTGTAADASGDSGATDTSAADTGASDTGATTDSGTDGALTDGDAVATDTATSTDTGAASDTASDAAGCHTLVWGGAELTFAKVTSLPTMTGGTIATGIYDATAVQTTGTLTGKYRGTWQFDPGGTMKIYEAVASGDAALPTPTPKTLTWSTAASTLSRTQTCGGTTAFSNGYTVRTVGADTFLDVQSGTLQFTFKKR